MDSSPNPPTSQLLPKASHIFLLHASKPSHLLNSPKLTGLYFSPTSRCYIPWQFFPSLCRGLKSLRSLKVLNLNLSNTGIVGDKGLKDLSLILRRLHHLTIIKLNLQKNSSITGKGIATLMKNLEKNGSLRELSIDFSGCGEVFQTNLDSIYSSVSSLKSLTSLQIHHDEVPFENIQKLAETFAKLRKLCHLEDLFMNLNLSQRRQSLDILALCNSIRRMTRLSKVHLYLKELSNVSQESLEHLACSLKSLQKIEKFHLHFAQPTSRFAEKHFDIITKAFQNSPTIKILILDFSGILHAVSFQTKDPLISLQTLTCLSHLDLNFRYCQNFDPRTLQFVAQGIQKLTNLTTLKLNFHGCPLVDGQSFLDLADILRNLTSLEVFELSLMRQSSKSDFGLFAEALAHQVNFSKLVLNFSQSKEFGDQDMKELTKSFEKLHKLKSLELNLGCCLKITNAGVNDLASRLCTLQSLNTLNLNFFGCEKITAKGGEFLKSHLILLESLKETSLKFPNHLNSAGFIQQKPSHQSTCSIF